MRTFLLTLIALLSFGSIVPEAHARGSNRSKVLKAVDVSNDPAVKAADKANDESAAALEAAKLGTDAKAVEAARKKHDETQAALSKVRADAVKEAMKKRK